jgi:ribonuclease D
VPRALVDTRDGFAAVVDALRDEPVYALDTEFHRERTYFPKLALVQLAWRDELALVDPLAVDVAPLADVLDGPGTAVLHAADQDLEVLELACGTVPRTLFDTQLAAGFTGLSTPSLGALCERVLGVTVPKADRLSDWLGRPLAANQLEYAAGDVAHLLELHRRLVDDLTRRGRLAWALDECEELRARVRGARNPLEAWRRIKEARQLRGRARAMAQAVAAWRERRAAAIDVPVRYVMPDLAIVGIAQRPPGSIRELHKIRGLDERHLRKELAEELLEVIRKTAAAPKPPRDEAPPRDLDRELRPAVGLVSAWVGQLARDLELDTALLATRADLEALLRGEPDARLAVGWRAELVGEPIRQLVDGRAALAFGGGGKLVLEARSHRPLGPATNVGRSEGQANR